MKTLCKGELLILVPETPEEAAALAAWKQDRAGHVAAVVDRGGGGLCLRGLGPEHAVCRVPINVSSLSTDPQITLISNFAATPFELDGRPYASVESFWQGLRFSEPERPRIAALVGAEAKKAGREQPYQDTLIYNKRTIRVGTCEHWRLMEAACRAKFSQHAEARAALLATGDRPLTHKVRPDSRTIPGVVMADIWMRIRRLLQKGRGGNDMSSEC